MIVAVMNVTECFNTFPGAGGDESMVAVDAALGAGLLDDGNIALLQVAF